MPRNTNRRYVTDYEFAIWAIKKGNKWTFNKPTSISYLKPKFKYSIVPKSKEKIHPTQKPISLLENINKIHTNKGDTIFDPFMGSGSTGCAAIKLNRNFIGTEIEQNYFNMAEKRINEYWQNSKLSINKKIFRSPLYYIGDKYKLIPQFMSIFPKNINTFYDVFSGGTLYLLI